VLLSAQGMLVAEIAETTFVTVSCCRGRRAQGLFRPDGLAGRVVSGSPTAGALGDEEKPASAFVNGGGSADVR
jgi:hypothetical protein